MKDITQALGYIDRHITALKDKKLSNKSFLNSLCQVEETFASIKNKSEKKTAVITDEEIMYVYDISTSKFLKLKILQDLGLVIEYAILEDEPIRLSAESGEFKELYISYYGNERPLFALAKTIKKLEKKADKLARKEVKLHKTDITTSIKGIEPENKDPYLEALQAIKETGICPSSEEEPVKTEKAYGAKILVYCLIGIPMLIGLVSGIVSAFI